MKFAQQLRQGAVEEWRRAYIDYRLLKKLIKAAAKSEPDGGGGADPDESDAAQPINVPASPTTVTPLSASPSTSDDINIQRHQPPSGVSTSPRKVARIERLESRSSHNSDTGNVLRRRKSSRPGSIREATRWRYNPSSPLKDVIPRMNPAERKFFDVLDQELEKVQAFYEERETEALDRYKVLREQLDQLAEHRAQYFASQSKTSRLVPDFLQHAPGTLKSITPKAVDAVNHMVTGQEPSASSQNSQNGHNGHNNKTNPADRPSRFTSHLNPENYVAARRKLKVAMWEFYRFLGYVKNYRLLNRTGFSKVTKKMEKVTRIKCQREYTAKVSKTHFATSTVIDDLQSETENLFGVNFEKGSRKKAVQRLRFMGATTTHHFASWRSGVYLGLALPPLIDGIVKSCHSDVHASIPGTASLLQLYGAMLLPVLLALGVGINLVGWTLAHINIPLVFYFDTRTHLDYRVYLEIPSLLLCTLAWCFWLSFNAVSTTVSPQVWPIVWLISTILILFNPFPVFHAHARWWIIRSTFRVFSAGLFKVQFRDFWLGDQFCSLYYTSYNLGLIVCAYCHHFGGNVNTVCSTNMTWASPILASLPYLWRLGQSIRRFTDAPDVPTHLVNAGKYAASVIYLFLYFEYRIHGSHHNATFVLFIVFATINSVYSVSWDMLMDWNLLKRDAKYPLLRNELAFKDYIWFYYFALFTNFIGRFSWFIYLIPGTEVRLRGFIVALIETVRRFQWNFLRVESEHLGNVDGFRVTRDVPLPYVIPHTHATSSTSIGENVDDDDAFDEQAQSENYKIAEGTGQELGARISKFPHLMPGEVGKRLKAAVLGRKLQNLDESDDEDDSPVTDTQPSSGQGESIHARRDASAPRTSTASSQPSVQRSGSRNYNTFGWESDPERLADPRERTA